ncbi:MAG: lysine--tRNA ligase [Myxococcaceae bacterium]
MSDEGVKEKELFEQRLKSAEEWRKLGANPYGNGHMPAHTAGEIERLHGKDGAEALEQKKLSFSVAGRIMGWRSKKMVFADLIDRTGRIQLSIKPDVVGPEVWKLVEQIDLGDFIYAEGTLFRTRGNIDDGVRRFLPVAIEKEAAGDSSFAGAKAMLDAAVTTDPKTGKPANKRFQPTDTAAIAMAERAGLNVQTMGDLTLTVTKFVPLTKTLRAPPASFVREGATDAAKDWNEKQAVADTEQRYRQRYVDLLGNASVKQTFVRRTKLVQYIRHFLDDRDFLEVETPMMHSLVSGAAARPFRTHHNALDMDLYMRIAPELHLKRLVVGGFDRVYEINRNFRNEGISTRHNPEFTMLEFYWAYAVYTDLMDLTEEMISGAAKAVCGTDQLTYGDVKLSFAKGWPRIPMWQSIREKVPALTERDFNDLDRLRAMAIETLPKEDRSPDNIKARQSMNQGELLGALFEQNVEHTLMQPTFITEYPTAISPLARRNDKNPEITDRFELFCLGREIANGFSELNDPVDQRGRFQAQVEAKARGQEETMDYDEDYVRALEHGLPPTAGEGIGIDRLAMLLTNSASIRDVILFPLLKPQAK